MAGRLEVVDQLPSPANPTVLWPNRIAGRAMGRCCANRELLTFINRQLQVSPLETVLLTSKGTPIATRLAQGGDRNDSIARTLRRFNKDNSLSGNFLMFKKTSASFIDDKFKGMKLSQLFRGHSPAKTVEK